MTQCIKEKRMYSFLCDNHYRWDRKDTSHIWVALNGYKVFGERYDALMEVAKANGFVNVAQDFDEICGKTFYVFKHGTKPTKRKAVYKIFLNDELVGECPATKKDAQAWIREHLLSTHMGRWKRVGSRHGWLYNTTIGRYYSFVKENGQ